MSIPDPQNLLWYDAVQIFALVGIIFGGGWLAKRVLALGDRVLRLEILMTNHYAHRFAKVAKELGIEKWEDEEE